MKDDRDPAIFAFGTRPIERLSREEEAKADFEARLRSIWKYLVRRCARAHARLSNREKVTYGLDDLLSEVSLALRKKDHHWTTERGRYVTFAEQVCKSCLADLKVRAGVIHTPDNAIKKLEELRRLRDAGTLDARQARTLVALERALGDVEALPHQPDEEHEALAEPALAERHAERAEGLPARREAARAIVAGLGPLPALVLTRTFGLFGAAADPDGRVLPRQSPARSRRIAEQSLARLRQFASSQESLP